MKSQNFIKTINHAERSAFERSSQIDKQAFDLFYEDISDHWQERAKRLRLRRWHKIKQQNA